MTSKDKYKAAVSASQMTNAALSKGPANGPFNAMKALLLESIGHRLEAELDREAVRERYPKILTTDGKAFVLNFYMFSEIEKWAKKIKTGNCGEFSIAAFQNLINVQNVESPIEFVRAKNHWLVVLNRNAETPLKSPDLWNDDAIVCDAWRNKADYIAKFLNNVSRFTAIESLRMPDDNPGGYLLVPHNWKSW